MKQGKYDPPDKAKVMAENPSTLCLGDVLHERSKHLKTSFEKYEEHEAGASRASERDASKKGRKPKVTANAINVICECLSEGNSEKAACLKAGIGLTAWNRAKKNNPDICQKIQEARQAWANLKYKRHMATLYESQLLRPASKKAKRPQPTKQAKLIQWHLTFTVPLSCGAIPREEIEKACKRFNYPSQMWWRQSSTFGLLNKVYEKRAKLRGDHLWHLFRESEHLSHPLAQKPHFAVTDFPVFG